MHYIKIIYFVSHLQTITSSVNAKQKSRVISRSSLPTFDEVLYMHIHTYMYAHTLRIEQYNNVSFCMCVFNYSVYMGVWCGVYMGVLCRVVCSVVWCVHGCGVWCGVYMGVLCTWVCGVVWCVVWCVHGCAVYMGVWCGVYMGVWCVHGCAVSCGVYMGVVTVEVVFRVLQVLEFSVEGTQLYLTSLTISVWDHKKITKDVFLGMFNTLFLNFNSMMYAAPVLTE